MKVVKKMKVINKKIVNNDCQLKISVITLHILPNFYNSNPPKNNNYYHKNHPN
jgi:hypothetical protein